MTRLLTLVTVILAIISLASAQIVDTLNTPLGPVTQGAKVSVSWTLLPGVDAAGKNGDLSATDSASKNVIPIDPAVPLAPKTYLWEVKVPPGTYTLGLNDGSGLKQSGEVVVKAPVQPSGSDTPPAGTSKAPETPGSPTAGVPTSTGSPAGGSGSAGGSAGGSPGGAAGGGTTGSTGGSTPPDNSNPSNISTPKPNSASLIFSGYEIVFSLLGIAVAMVQF